MIRFISNFMTTAEENIYKSLNLLVMLSRAKQKHFPNLPEEKKATLKITRQLLADSDLTVPEFTNSLSSIAQKGYVWHIVFFDEHLRKQIDDFLKSPDYGESLEKLKVLNTKEISDKINNSIKEDLIKIVPKNVTPDLKESEPGEVKFTDLFQEGLEAYKELRPDELAIVVLMPFRNINDLYSRMGKGEKFEDIQDDGFWYDQTNFQFHIEGIVIKTTHNDLPVLAHYVLKEFFNNPSTKKVDYEDLSEFDKAKGSVPYRDSMRGFVKKHPKLKDLFTVREYNTEFHPEKYRDTP